MAGRRLLYAAVAGCAALLALCAFVRRPDHAFLVGGGGAEWVRAARPFGLVAREPRPETALFRHRFTLSEAALPAANALLRVQVLRSFRLLLNGREVGSGGADAASWRYAQSFDLSPYLVAGSNELRIEVKNERGAPLLLASAPALGIATPREWQAPGPEGTWQPVVQAGEGREHPISREFPSAWQGLRQTWGLLLVAFALGAGVSLVHSRGIGAQGPWRLGPGHVRWLVLGALAVLGLHNLRLVGIDAGFDAVFHFDYIRYVATARRVPLANEGWQYFQAPLFYLVAAPSYLMISKLASQGAAMLAMRVLVLFFSLGLAEMAHRAARVAYPEREDLQIVATAVGGFLPMTVYMSHYVSNEPLAAFLTAALVVSAFRLLADASPNLDRRAFALGLLFGLALLAKVTVALLLPLLAGVLLRAVLRRGLPLQSAIGPLARFALAGAAVSGWYFARNWIALGSPVVYSSYAGTWVQDPGYRIPADLLSFGASLHYPVYAVFSGLWDALYSSFWLDSLLGSGVIAFTAPPWHYPQVVASALLALPLSAAGIVGFVRALRMPRSATQEALLFSSLAVCLYLAAIFALYLRLPVFSTVKSTYTLGLAPCYGVLIAWGIDLLPRRPAVRALLAGYLTAWLALVFRAYFS